jgi:hypothetical protein
VGLLNWVNNAGLEQAALAYAKLGWPVLPLEPRDKRPLTMHGLKDASTESEQIRTWWRQWPKANIGLRTGIAFDALDLDGPESKIAMTRLAPKYYHKGPISSTGKGYHLLFSVTGAKNHTRINGFPIDFRGDNGYIVAPPSVHPNGHRYKWAREGPLEEAPDWLLPLVFPPKLERTSDPNDPKIRAMLAESGDIVEMMSAISTGPDNGAPQRIGNRYVLYCPFHADDTASLVLYMDSNSFFCFGCGAWGDPLNVKYWLETGRLRKSEARKVSPIVGVTP